MQCSTDKIHRTDRIDSLGFMCAIIMFVCLGVFFVLFFTPMETSPLPVKGCKFWSMLGTHGHVQHLLWQGTSVYNGHLRGPVRLTPIAERLAVELSLPVFTLGLSRLEFKLPSFRLRGERSNPLRRRRGCYYLHSVR